MKIKILTFIGILGLLSASLVSCIKDDVKDLGTRGTPRVRIGEAPENIQYFSIFTDHKTIDLTTIRRDEVTNADVNQTVTVKLVNSPDSMDVYNSNTGASFESFPDSLYTIVTDKGVAKAGDEFTVTFAPGVTAIPISIIIDGSKWDVAHSYAFYLKVTDGGGKELYLDKDEALAGVAIKNEWQGSYHSVGVFHHPVNGDRPIDEDKKLITSGATSVEAPLGDLGGSGYYMILNVNPDNTVTITPSGATPNIDQSWGPNYYDPAEKAFHLYYSYNTSAPRKVEETITLK